MSVLVLHTAQNPERAYATFRADHDGCRIQYHVEVEGPGALRAFARQLLLSMPDQPVEVMQRGGPTRTGLTLAGIAE